jgi:RNA polymerase sigma factor (sigma-70 family)
MSYGGESMNAPGGPHLEETLDRHGAFVRNLARSLVFDESRADDVAQQTWLAAARRPPRDAATARGWLARVARNFSFRMRRDDARRATREHRAARPESAATPRSTPAGAAMLREVIEAVLALDEPYRATVLMRFYENLEPAEIAERAGVPAATVRTRLKRALDKLRDRFDAKHGGDRAAWTAPLLPVALGALKPAAVVAAAGAASAAASAPALSGIALGGIFMAKKIGIVCGLAAIAVVSVVIAMRSNDDAPGPVTPDGGGATIATAPPVQPETPVKSVESGPITARPYVPTEDERGPSEIVLAPKGAPSATVVGRVVDQRGVPQPNVPVTLRTVALVVDPDEGAAVAEITDERQLQTRTDANGRFSFAQLPLGVEARVRARPEKLCDAARPASITQAGQVDLGDLVAVAGGSIAGVVLNPQGLPVRNCRMNATSVEGVAAAGFGMFSFRRVFDGETRSAVTNADGQYRIDGLPEGQCAVAAVADEYPSETKSEVRVRLDEVTWETDFKLSPGASVAGVVRDPENRPIAGATVVAVPAEVKLAAPDVPTERSKKATTGPDGRFVLQGLRADPMIVRARKPGFVTASQRGVTAGTDLAFTLKPAGVVFGHVRNGVTNEPVPDFTMKIVTEPSLEGPGRARVLRGADAAKAAQVPEAPGLFALTDLPESPVQLKVRAPEFADAEIAGVRAPSGDKAQVNVALSPQAQIRGIVVDGAGNPVEGARISATNSKPEPGTVDAGGGAMRVRARRRVVARGQDPATPLDEPAIDRGTTSGPDGSFTVKSLPGGTYRLTASHREFAGSPPTEVVLQPSGLAEGVRLVLEMGGTFAGNALDADGKPVPGARINLQPRSERGNFERVIGEHRGPIANSRGEFEITGIRPGQYYASLEGAEAEAGIHLAIATDEPQEPEGELVTIEAGKTVRKDLQQKPRASIGGIVKEGGKPAPGVKLSLVAKGAPEFFGQGATRTDEHGIFTIDKVAPGDYTLLIDPPGAPMPTRRAVTLLPRAEQRVTIDLPTGAIEGRVTDKTTGKPIAGVTISAMVEESAAGGDPPQVTRTVMVTATADEDGSGIQAFSFGGGAEPVRTDADGRYRLRYVGAGRYRISIKGASLMPLSRSGVAVEEGRTVSDVDFAGEKGATLLVQVDAAGHDVSQVVGFIEIADSPDSHDIGTGTVKNGIRYQGLKPGRYHVRVDAPMKELEGEADVDVAAGQEARVTVRLAERN